MFQKIKKVPQIFLFENGKIIGNMDILKLMEDNDDYQKAITDKILEIFKH